MFGARRRAAAGRPADHRQGQFRDRGIADDLRRGSARRICPAPGRRGGGAFARRGGDRSRQEQCPAPHRRFPDFQRPVRRDLQSVGRDAHAGRLVGRRGGGGRLRFLRLRPRFRPRRFDPLAGPGLRPVRAEAELGPGFARRPYPAAAAAAAETSARYGALLDRSRARPPTSIWSSRSRGIQAAPARAPRRNDPAYSGSRSGSIRDFAPVDPDVEAGVRLAAQIFGDAGALVVEAGPAFAFAEAFEIYVTLNFAIGFAGAPQEKARFAAQAERFRAGRPVLSRFARAGGETGRDDLFPARASAAPRSAPPSPVSSSVSTRSSARPRPVSPFRTISRRTPLRAVCRSARAPCPIMTCSNGRASPRSPCCRRRSRRSGRPPKDCRPGFRSSAHAARIAGRSPSPA